MELSEASPTPVELAEDRQSICFGALRTREGGGAWKTYTSKQVLGSRGGHPVGNQQGGSASPASGELAAFVAHLLGNHLRMNLPRCTFAREGPWRLFVRILRIGRKLYFFLQLFFGRVICFLLLRGSFFGWAPARRKVTVIVWLQGIHKGREPRLLSHLVSQLSRTSPHHFFNFWRFAGCLLRALSSLQNLGDL